MKKILTTCTYCGCGCGLYLQVEGNEVIGVTPSREHPISRGSLCVKGWNIHEFIQHPDRLKTPLIKKKGKFRETSWDEALDLVAHRLGGLKKKFGSHSLAVLGSAKCTNEENYLLSKFTRATLGTNNIDHCARLCHSSTVVGLATAFGSGAMTNSINEIEEADCLLVTGSNTTLQHPQIGSRILNAVEKGARLIVVDPRTTQLVSFAHLHLKPRPGTDVAWINGMMHIILKEDLADLDFIRKRTENFSALKRKLAKFTPQYVERITGIPREDIKEAAGIYARAKRAILIYSMGITQHTTGTDNVLSLANLVLLTSHVGRPYTGLNPLRGQNNVQGACDMGALPDFYSGYQRVSDTLCRRKFERVWNVRLPQNKGLTIIEMIQEARKGKIKGMYIMGENPALSDPDITHTVKALKNLDFLVVQDIFLTETAQLADVVLPGASFAEKDGTFTSTERRVQRVRKSINPVGEAKADWEIICDLSRRMGYFLNYESPEEVMEEIALLTPIYGGIYYDRLEETFGLQWPCWNKKHPGTPFLHRGSFSRGKGHFTPVDYKPAKELPSKKYPFILTTGRLYYHWHTGSMTRRSSTLHREYPHGFIEMNVQDAQKLGIKNKEIVKVISRRGAIEIQVIVGEIIIPGTVFIPFHFKEAAANLLTNPVLDPRAKIPEYKVCAVRIERIER